MALWGKVWQRGDIVSSVRVMDGSWQGHLTHNFLFFILFCFVIIFVKNNNKKFTRSNKYNWFIYQLMILRHLQLYFGDLIWKSVFCANFLQLPAFQLHLYLGQKEFGNLRSQDQPNYQKVWILFFQKSFVIKRFQKHFCVPADFTLMEIIHWGL